jgi:hypothetical protein
VLQTADIFTRYGQPAALRVLHCGILAASAAGFMSRLGSSTESCAPSVPCPQFPNKADLPGALVRPAFAVEKQGAAKGEGHQSSAVTCPRCSESARVSGWTVLAALRGQAGYVPQWPSSGLVGLSRERRAGHLDPDPDAHAVQSQLDRLG